MYNESDGNVLSDISITGFAFIGASNTTVGAWGYSDVSTAVLRYCYFSDNFGEFGGAVNIYHETKDGMKLWLEECTFVNNVAKYGSAVLVEAGWASVSLCSFTGHRGAPAGSTVEVSDEGWPIEVIFYGTLVLNDSCFQDNVGTVYIYEEGTIEEYGGNFAALNQGGPETLNCNRGLFDNNQIEGLECKKFEGTECLVTPLQLISSNGGDDEVPTMAPVVDDTTASPVVAPSTSATIRRTFRMDCVGALIAAAYYLLL